MLTLQTSQSWGNWDNSNRAPTELLINQDGTVITAGGNEGIISLYSASSTLLATSGSLPESGYSGDIELTEITIDGQQYTVASGYYFTDALLYAHNGINFGSPEKIMQHGALSMVHDIEAQTIGNITYIYTASRRTDSIEVWKTQDGDGWTKIQTVKDDLWEKAGSVQDIALSNGYIYAASQETNSITSFAISSTGQLEQSHTINPTDGLLLSRPSGITAFEINGETYLCVSANKSSSISLIKADANGEMQVLDNVSDRTDTLFKSANLIRHFETNGLHYVAVSGGEPGFSIFMILPNGKFHHIASVSDSEDTSLDNIEDLEVWTDGNDVIIYASSLKENGVTKIQLDTSKQGQIISSDSSINGSNNNDILTLTGETGIIKAGDGDDILTSGTGSSILHGGAGSDTFYIRGTKTTVRDFEIDKDKIDISALGITANDSIRIAKTTSGTVIKINNDTKIVLKYDTTNTRDLSYADLFSENRSDPDNAPIIIENPDDSIPDGEEIMPGIFFHTAPQGKHAKIQGHSGNDIIFGDRPDPDYNDTSSDLVRVYQAAFGRSPDKGGFLFWMGELQGGLDFGEMVESFIDSEEYSNRYGASNPESYIQQLYENSLGRAPDSAGKAYWVDIMEKNPNMRTEIFLYFANSEELKVKSLKTTAEFSFTQIQAEWSGPVYRLYTAIFGRNPDMGGMNYWTEKLTSVTPYKDVIAYFLSSNEYVNTYGSSTDVDFVDLLYVNVHGRAPDAEGYNFWLNALSSGMSRGEVVREFVESHEYIRNSNPLMLEWMRTEAQDDILNGKGGDDIFIGGVFADTFVFECGRLGKSTIIGFEEWDSIELQNSDYATAQDVIDDITAYEGGCKITLEDQEIFIPGVTPDQFTPDNFILT